MSKNLSDIFPDAGSIINGGVEEAPKTGKMYARKDENWEEFDTGNLEPGNQDGETLSWSTVEAEWIPDDTLMVDTANEVVIVDGVFTSRGITDQATSTAITIDSSQKVGINTPTPSVALDVRGAPNGACLQVDPNVGVTDRNLIVSNSSNGQGWNINSEGGVSSLGTLSLSTNSTPRMTIASTGNVGIGQDAPSAPLTVDGPSNDTYVARFGNFAGGGGSIQGRTDIGLDFWATESGTHPAAAVGVEQVSTDQYRGGLLFSTRGTNSDVAPVERMRIDAAGNVGINTPNPSVDLEVNGIARVNSYLSMNNNGFIRGEYSGELRLQGGTTATTFYNSANNTEFMRINDSGRVGISNSSPSSYTGAGAPSLVIGDHTGFEGVTLASSTSGTGNIAFADSASGSEQYRGLMRYDHSEDSMQLWTNSVRRMTIDTSGKVGIGVTNPQQALHVAGGGLQIEGNISAPAAGTECALIDYFNNNMRLWSRGTATTRGTFEFIQVENDGQNQQSSMVIDSTGNVGIGKTPTESLRLEALAPTGFSVGSGFYSETTQSTITFSDSNTTAAYKVRVGSEGDELLMFAGGSEVMRIDASGNVLVGRASVSAAATDHGWQAYNTGIVYQYADAATSTDVHRWYNGAGSLVASINARGEGFFLGGATYSGPLKADEIIQDGAPVVDSLQIIRAFMKLRAATADPDSTVEELREKLKTAVDDIIDQFQDQIDNMPTPLED